MVKSTEELSRELLSAIGSGMGLTQRVRDAVEAGADVNYRTRGGDTPLTLALCDEADSVVLFLIAAGAKVDGVDGQGNPLLMMTDSFQIAEALIEAGAPIDAQDKQGWTPLLEAVHCGRADLAALFIRRGANYECKYGAEGRSIWDEARSADDQLMLMALTQAIQHVKDEKEQTLRDAFVKGVANDLEAKRDIAPVRPLRFKRKPSGGGGPGFKQ